MASEFEPDPELSEIATKLWELDENRCEPGVDYEIYLQGRVYSGRKVGPDRAREDLFDYVTDDVFERKTYKTFVALLNNYQSETGLPEQVTSKEIQENWDFLNAVMETPLMQEAHQFLVSRDRAPSSEDDFKEELYKIWFKLIRRTRGDRDFDSSGFEHVFVGETRGRSVIGFHNWIQFYIQEKADNIDYKGYFKYGTSKEEFPRLLTLQFTWKKGQGKAIGSSFIGCSPEFELALYTIVFLMDQEKVDLQIADYSVQITCYKLGKGIGTAYPTCKE